MPGQALIPEAAALDPPFAKLGYRLTDGGATVAELSSGT